MADEKASLEKGEYVIGIAIILAALLVSATVWISAGNLEKAMGKFSVSAPTAAPTQAAQPTQAAEPTQAAASGDWSFIAEDPGIGPKDAKAVLIEFSDFQCPYCAIAYGREFGGASFTEERGTAKKFTDEYAKTGKARFVYAPVAFFGRESADAANAAYCAREIGGDEGFFKMHDKLFDVHNGQENVGTYSKDNLKKYAAEIGYNTSAFVSCIDTDKFVSLVVKNTQDAQAVGVTGTPNYALNNRLMQAGIIPYSTIKAAVDAALAG